MSCDKSGIEICISPNSDYISIYVELLNLMPRRRQLGGIRGRTQTMLGFDRTFKAMSDPTRRAILRVLRGGARNAGQIKDDIGIAANALSFHLRILKDADLVRDRRKGQFIEYELNTTVMDDMIRFLMDNFGAGDDHSGRKKPGQRSTPDGAARNEKEQP